MVPLRYQFFDTIANLVFNYLSRSIFQNINCCYSLFFFTNRYKTPSTNAMENLILLAFLLVAVVGITYKVAERFGFVEKDSDEPEKLWSVMNACRACSRLLFIIIGAILFLYLYNSSF